MVKIIIDDKTFEAPEGTTILQAARSVGINIPTLCFNEELTPAGACRVCVVEVLGPERAELASACNTPVYDGMVVATASPAAAAARRTSIEMLLAQSPHSRQISSLAASCAAEKQEFELEAKECILCQLCVRACREAIGVEAITLVTQGPGRREPAHVEVDWDKCIACASCAYICPTEAITAEDAGDVRTISITRYRNEFKMKACSACGALYAPEKQIQFMAEKSGLEMEKFELCMDCRP